MKIAIHTPTEKEYNELVNTLSKKGFTQDPAYNYFWDGEKTTVSVYLDPFAKIVGKHYYLSNEFREAIPYADLKSNNFKLTIEI